MTMILSTSIPFRFFAIASLVVCGASSSIRGKQEENSEIAQDDQQRNLVEIDMSIGLGKMECKEHPSDGSVVCTFRTMPPTDLSTGKLMHDCMFGSSMGNFCLSTEVYRIPFNEVPPSSQEVINIVPQNPPPRPANPYPVGSVGFCPTRQQNTGVGCSQYIPAGQTSTVCLYGQTRCECNVRNNNLAIPAAWNCFVVQPQQQTPKPPPMVLPAPTPAVVPNPTPPKPPPANGGSFSNFQCRPRGVGCSSPHVLPSDCSGTPACCPGNIIEDWRTQRNTCKHGATSPATNIDANINAVPSPTPAPVRVSTGQILPNIVNAESCPETKPDDGVDCTWGQRCTYYVEDAAGNKVKAVDCNCAGDCVFTCRDSTNPAFSF